jgi:hypothetical protein
VIHREPVRAVHQIEITSRCNLRCSYCASPYLARPKVDMTPEHFARALDLALECRDEHGQRSLNLAGIGESTIHPRFVEYVAMAREALGEGFDLVFATNGVAVDEAMVRALLPLRPRVFVSLHRPERAKVAYDLFMDCGLLAGYSNDAVLSSTDWAGQVAWRVTAQNRFGRRECDWVKSGWVMAMADGRLTTCSFDASGVGVVGHVDQPLEELYVSPYELCHGCDQAVGFPLADVPRPEAGTLKEHALRDRELRRIKVVAA